MENILVRISVYYSSHYFPHTSALYLCKKWNKIKIPKHVQKLTNPWVWFAEKNATWTRCVLQRTLHATILPPPPLSVFFLFLKTLMFLLFLLLESSSSRPNVLLHIKAVLAISIWRGALVRPLYFPEERFSLRRIQGDLSPRLCIYDNMCPLLMSTVA